MSGRDLGGHGSRGGSFSDTTERFESVAEIEGSNCSALGDFEYLGQRTEYGPHPGRITTYVSGMRGYRYQGYEVVTTIVTESGLATQLWGTKRKKK